MMPAVKDLVSATLEQNRTTFNAFAEHCSGLRTDTKSIALNLLRKTYPDYHVTEAHQSMVNLLEYAKAGHAVAVRDDNDEAFNSTREWHPAGERLENKLNPGQLADDDRMARFQYIWENKEYLVYYLTWKDMLESPAHMFYVLYPRTAGNVVEGHCAESDTLILAAGKWTSQLHEEIFVFDSGYWEKSKELWKSVHESSWDDVILEPEMKKSLIEDVQGFFDNQQLYADFAVPWKRGIILHGVPGNGKTVSIKALMSALYHRSDAVSSLYVKSLQNCNGEQYAVQQIFQQARKSAPCLLIFEDLDSLLIDEVRSYFLNEVDGLESNDGILMIGSTNHLDRLDPAISKRPSRFDRKYHFKLPSETERTLYADYWRNKLTKNATIDFPKELCSVIAKLSDGFSFAYMKELFVMALLTVARGLKVEDFEFVDAHEAEGAKKEDAAPAASHPPDEEEAADANKTCQCEKHCDRCGKPKGDEKKATAAKKDDQPDKKMVMPAVDIPESLEENYLLKVIKYQIRILHSEMDNTKEEQWPSSSNEIGGGVVDPMTALIRRNRRARRC